MVSAIMIPTDRCSEFINYFQRFYLIAAETLSYRCGVVIFDIINQNILVISKHSHLYINKSMKAIVINNHIYTDYS